MNKNDLLVEKLKENNPRRILPRFHIATILTQSSIGLEYRVANDKTVYHGNVLYEDTIPRVSADGVLQATQALASRHKHEGPLDVTYTHNEEGTTVRFLQRTNIEPYYRMN